MGPVCFPAQRPERPTPPRRRGASGGKKLPPQLRLSLVPVDFLINRLRNLTPNARLCAAGRAGPSDGGAAPSLNLFAVGLPASLAVGVVALAIAFPAMGDYMLVIIREGLAATQSLVLG